MVVGPIDTRMADEAVYIGPAPAAESYLVAENILKAVAETGAEAVHPGAPFAPFRSADRWALTFPKNNSIHLLTTNP